MRASDYHAISREKLAGNWKIAMVISLIALYLGGLMVNANVRINISLDDYTKLEITSILFYPIVVLGLSGLVSIIQLIISGVVRQGYAVYLLKQHDGHNPEIGDLFSQFHRFGDGFCLKLLESLFVFLWTLLFIIPGIIASLSYAMAPFIMAENEGMTASEALSASKELMNGHKWELFCLNFSFIGWELLNVLTLGLGSLALNPYMNAAYAAFYREISRFA